jgi:hypothetical protein
MTEVTPQDFDFDAWLEDADRPERAVTVYRKSGLIADMDVLSKRIEDGDEDDVDGPSMGGGVGKLRAEYAELARQFHESALTVRVHSLTKEEQVAINDTNPDLKQGELGFHILAAAMSFPKASPAQLRKMQESLGEAQFGLIIKAFNQACNEVPAVSADFLPKPSTRGDGGES